MGRPLGAKAGLVYGFGITDIPTRENYVEFAFYRAWYSLIRRVYGAKQLARNPTYIGCSVDPRWQKLSNFKKWFDKNYIRGYELDKDINVPGNKVYVPDTCCYVPQELNKLFTDSAAARGKYPQGVSLYRKSGKFHAQIKMYGKVTHIGYFDDAGSAHAAWLSAKRNYIKEVVQKLLKEKRITRKLYNATIAKGKSLV